MSFDEERLLGSLGINSLHTVYLRLAHLFNQEPVKSAEQCRGLLPPDPWLDTVLRSPGLVRIHHKVSLGAGEGVSQLWTVQFIKK